MHFTITLAWTWISFVISRTSLNRGSLNQGSTLLGPTLFCIHITSVVSTTPESSVFLYAYDTEIHHLNPNLETAVLKINSNLQNISTWLRNNNLILNTKKEEAMIVAKKAPMSSADILLNNNELSVVETFKYLGVTVDSCLNWEPHISQLIERVSPKIAFLNRLAGFLDTNISNSCHTAWNVWYLVITHKVRSKVFQFTCAVVSISKWRKEQNGSRAHRKGLLTNTSKYLVLGCRVIVLFFLFLGCPVIVLFNSLLGIISNVFV